MNSLLFYVKTCLSRTAQRERYRAHRKNKKIKTQDFYHFLQYENLKDLIIIV